MVQETKRTRRVGELVQKSLSTIFQEDKPLPGSLLTILDVRVSVDLAYARIHVSILGANDNWDQEVAILNNKASHYRRVLAKNWVISKVPQLIFVGDDSHSRGAKLNRFIDSLV